MMDGILGVVGALQTIPGEMWFVLGCGLVLFFAIQKEVLVSRSRGESDADVLDDERRAIRDLEYQDLADREFDRLAADDKARRARQQLRQSNVVSMDARTRDGVDVRRSDVHPLSARKPRVGGDVA